MFRGTPTGLPLPMGVCRLRKKLGTVPNFWEVERLDPAYVGAVVKCMVYPEDFLEAGPGLKLTVIDGGKNNGSGY